MALQLDCHSNIHNNWIVIAIFITIEPFNFVVVLSLSLPQERKAYKSFAVVISIYSLVLYLFLPYILFVLHAIFNYTVAVIHCKPVSRKGM